MTPPLSARYHGPDLTPPVVLLHELGGSAASFRWLVPYLGDLRTIALDLPGTRSSPLLAPSASGLIDYAEAVWSFLDAEIRRPAVILGIALGAAIGAVISARHPDAVSGLIFCCMGPGIPLRSQEFLRERSARVEREGVSAVVELSLERSFPPALRRGREAVYAEYARDLASADAAGYVRQSLALAHAGSAIADSIRSARAPVSIVAGAYDGHFAQTVVEELRRMVPNLIRVTVISQAGHLPHVQAPAQLADVVRDLVDCVRASM